MDGGHVIATGSPAEIKKRAGVEDLDAAFIALLPEEKRKPGNRDQLARLCFRLLDALITRNAGTKDRRYGREVRIVGVAARHRGQPRSHTRQSFR